MSIDSLGEGRDSTQGCASKHAELPQAWLTLRSRLNYPGARLQRNPVNVGTLPLPPSSLSPTWPPRVQFIRCPPRPPSLPPNPPPADAWAFALCYLYIYPFWNPALKCRYKRHAHPGALDFYYVSTRDTYLRIHPKPLNILSLKRLHIPVKCSSRRCKRRDRLIAVAGSSCPGNGTARVHVGIHWARSALEANDSEMCTVMQCCDGVV